MSRSRTVRPGFFRNEVLCQQPPLNRILFEGLWCEADREGRLRDSPAYLKAMILPYDDCDTDQMLAQLADAGFIQRYESDGKKYLQIPKFHKHQRPHPKEPISEIPPLQQDKLCAKPRRRLTQDQPTSRPSRGLDQPTSRLNPSVSSFPSGVSGISEISLPSVDPAAKPAVEVTIIAQPPVQGEKKTPEQPPNPKTEQQPPNRMAAERMARILADGAKMENRQGPGERKRQLKEQDRKRLNQQRAKDPPEVMAWNAVTDALAMDDPAKWIANPQIIAAVAAIGGWDYLGMLTDPTEAKPRFLEAYKAAATQSVSA